MTVKGLKSLQRSLEQLEDDLEDNAHNVAKESLDSTERGAKRRIVQNNTVAWGDLYSGFKQYRHPIQHERGPGTRFRLTNTEPHAKFVEWGTGDYFALGSIWGYTRPQNKYEAPSFSARLITAIAMWAAVKPSISRLESPREFAVPIARSISTPTENDPAVGTESQPFMRPAWFVESRNIDNKFRAAVKSAVRGV